MATVQPAAEKIVQQGGRIAHGAGNQFFGVIQMAGFVQVEQPEIDIGMGVGRNVVAQISRLDETVDLLPVAGFGDPE